MPEQQVTVVGGVDCVASEFDAEMVLRKYPTLAGSAPVETESSDSPEPVGVVHQRCPVGHHGSLTVCQSAPIVGHVFDRAAMTANLLGRRRLRSSVHDPTGHDPSGHNQRCLTWPSETRKVHQHHGVLRGVVRDERERDSSAGACVVAVRAQPETKWEIFLQVTSREMTQADAARKWQVDVSTVIGIRRRTVKDAALAALVARRGRPAKERNWELEAARREVEQLTEAVKAQAIELAMLRGKVGWA